MWLVLALTLLAHSAPWLELTYSGITPQLYEWDCAPACADTLLSWSQIPVRMESGKKSEPEAHLLQAPAALLAAYSLRLQGTA